MTFFNKKLKKDKGYAILFAVVVIGIISMITIGLSNAAYKQTILSSVARDSTSAFYQADIAGECALYFDNDTEDMDTTPVTTFNCAGYSLSFTKDTVKSQGGVNVYNILPPSETSLDKCFRVSITKDLTSNPISTTVESKGYNICNVSSIRTVERSLKVTY